jgi:hypothetical protein
LCLLLTPVVRLAQWRNPEATGPDDVGQRLTKILHPPSEPAMAILFGGALAGPVDAEVTPRGTGRCRRWWCLKGRYDLQD